MENPFTEQDAKDKESHDQFHRRACSYPSIEQQLDMLYHDIKNGNLENGDWIKSIESVKAKYPKP